jgi:uncharacterized protein (DUF1800 family)
MAISRADAAHLVRRTGFGVTPSRLQQVVATGSREAAVAQVMNRAANPLDLISPALSPLIPSLNGTQVDLLQLWWLQRMLYSPTPFVEKMTLFWHGHFATGQDKVQDISLLFGQNRTLRRLAFGRFNDLALAISVDPAMLIYLDNRASVAGKVQENFGRELLEAFTLGPAESSEADVIAMSTAWTGHGLDGFGRSYQFNAAKHDTTPTTLYGLAPRAWNGPDALRETLFGARAEQSSRFITAKLFSFLAYPVTPEDPVVGRLAATFRGSDLSIDALTRAVLLSQEFWSPPARFALVRSPLEWMVAALQATGQLTLLTDPVVAMRRLGHEPFNPPNVFGWRGQSGWVSTAAVWERAKWIDLVGERAANLGFLRETAGRSAEDVATMGFERFGIVDPAPATRRKVVAWLNAPDVVKLRTEKPTVFARQLVHLLAVTPDFQLA